MPTLNHPRIPNVTVDVPEQDVASWEASGWVAPAVEVHDISNGHGVVRTFEVPVEDDVEQDTAPEPKRRRK